MASLISIVDLKGKVTSLSPALILICDSPISLPSSQSLIQRSYRPDIPASAVERFLPLILEMEEENIQVNPCFSSEGVNYMWIRHNNLYCEYNMGARELRGQGKGDDGT